MQLNVALTSREIEALIQVRESAKEQAEKLIGSVDAGGSLKRGYQLEFGAGVIDELLKLAGVDVTAKSTPKASA